MSDPAQRKGFGRVGWAQYKEGTDMDQVVKTLDGSTVRPSEHVDSVRLLMAGDADPRLCLPHDAQYRGLFGARQVHAKRVQSGGTTAT